VEDASELQVLRSRLMTSALEERRRIERALHDGAQQDLIAISVLIQLARDLVETAPAEALASLDEVQRETRNALDRLRTLAGEVYPSILDARGLPDALRQAARTADAAAHVEAAEVGRYPAGIEAAVFFLWRAVLDDLESGVEVAIRVREEGEALQVEIVAGRAVDLASVRDLVEGAGGVLTDESQPGRGRVEVSFPLVR
jgi:signal transduction histidine kinase